MRRWTVTFLLALAACKSGGDDTPSGNAISDAYLAIGDKLAADDVSGLGELATQLTTAAEPSKADPGVADLMAGATAVAAPELPAAREAYRTMSTGMIQHLAAHPEQRAGLQLVHCPMTFDGDGAHWVQRAGKVMNPYEGSRMLHCGEVTPWEEGPKS